MFSYNEYKSIVEKVTNELPLSDSLSVYNGLDEFVFIRHDVEYSVERAYDLAKFESEELYINTAYLFQLRNNSYNILSSKNIQLVREMRDMGHEIGLHVHLGGLKNVDDIEDYVLDDISTLEKYFDFDVDIFSFHRPSQESLRRNVDIEDKINLYGDKFFHYYKIRRPKNVNVMYLPDSNHHWRFGHPLDLDLKKHKRIQINCHPFSWTPQGHDNLNNFKTLIDEKNIETIYSVNDETKTFPKELLP
tara:strand:+ start:5746 stop:6486 length:741 start_codon:yes stop_codon:yes gene_type:complete